MSSANSLSRAAAPARPTAASRADTGRALRMGTEEAAVLQLDLSDLPAPRVGGLQVDGFKPSFFERLFGKR
jgi:hypothetical protein